MARRKIYGSPTVRVEAHDARLIDAGGRILKVRLQPEAVAAAERIVDAGSAESVTEAINRALICYKPPKN